MRRPLAGMGTIIGTPPNALFVAYMAGAHGIEIDFLRLDADWCSGCTDHAATCLVRADPCGVPRFQGTRVMRAPEPFEKLAPVSRAEYMTGILMLVVAGCWIFRPFLADALPGVPLSDAGIAMTGAVLCFLLPVDLKRGRFLLSWDEAASIRWDVLILFGGGLALAAAIGESDLAHWMGARLGGLGALPLFVLLLVVGVLIVGVGELASNTAMAAVFLPVAGATVLGMGEPAVLLALPVALFATLGFMLPVATPPNAVIFGSGAVEIGQMLRAGVILDISGILIVAGIVMTLGERLLPPALP